MVRCGPMLIPEVTESRLSAPPALPRQHPSRDGLRVVSSRTRGVAISRAGSLAAALMISWVSAGEVGAQEAEAPAESEVNLLEEGGEDLLMQEAAAPADGQQGKEEEPSYLESLGDALMGLDLAFNWSGYGDTLFSMTFGKTKAIEKAFFDAYHFNLIGGAALGDRVYAEAEVEYEHGGDEIKLEYAFVDIRIFDWISARAGLFLVPVGLYNDNLHASFRWNQASRPRFFRDVVPSVWSDVGAQLFGNVSLGPVQLTYALYVVNGLGYEADFDPTSKEEPVRSMRGHTEDTNIDKAFGGRLNFGLNAGPAVRLHLGASGYSGATSPTDSHRLSIIDVHVSLTIGGFLLLGEFAQSFYGEQDPLTPFEQGAYVMAGYTFKSLDINTSVRWDFAYLRPYMGTGSFSHTIVASGKWQASTFWSLRTELALPFGDSFELGSPNWTTMLAFMF